MTDTIRGIHGLYFSSRPQATRTFLRDKLGLRATDIGDGWLIFDLPAAEVGVHPVESGRKHDSGVHDVSFVCDDLEGTVAELRSRGVRFDDEIDERSYGFAIHFTMPGGIRVQLFEPKYATHGSGRRPAARNTQTSSMKRSSAAKTKPSR